MVAALAVELAELAELAGRAEVAAATVDVVGSAVTVEADMMVVMMVVVEGVVEGTVGKCIRAVCVLHEHEHDKAITGACLPRCNGRCIDPDRRCSSRTCRTCCQQRFVE